MKEIREVLLKHLMDFILNSESKEVVKNAYRIYNILNSIRVLAELEKIEAEQNYNKMRNLVIVELMQKYPSISELLKQELHDEAEIPL